MEGTIFSGIAIDTRIEIASILIHNKQVLRETGAKVVKRLGMMDNERIDAILTKEKPDEWLIRKAKKLKAPIVTKEWVFQSLLKQKMHKIDSHPAFYFAL